MDRFKDISIVYKNVIRRTLEIIKKVPFILIIPVAFGRIYGLIISGGSLVHNLGTLSSFIMGILQAILLSVYFNVLRDAILYKRVNSNSFKTGVLTYAIEVYIVGFVFSLINILLGPIFASPIIAIIIFTILNPIGEAIYLGGEGGYNSIPNSFYYFKDNFHLWIPHIILFLALYFGFSLLSNLLANPLDSYIYPAFSNSRSDIPVYIYLIIRGFYDIFRGVLYIETRDSNMRKRIWRGDLD